MNKLKLLFVLAGLSILLILLGDLIAHESGVFVGSFLALLMIIVAYWQADRVVLHYYKAHQLMDTRLFQIVQSLASNVGLPMPSLYVITTDALNAFAVGRNPKKASIAVTSGLVAKLNEAELTGVLASILCQIRDRDTLVNSAAATIASSISGLANKEVWLSFVGLRNEKEESKTNPMAIKIVGPIAAILVRLIVSRLRVFDNDFDGAKLCGNSHGLASALEKMEKNKSADIFLNAATHPATAHLFIINPLTDTKLFSLFQTHPMTAERIYRLKTMEM